MKVERVGVRGPTFPPPLRALQNKTEVNKALWFCLQQQPSSQLVNCWNLIRFWMLREKEKAFFTFHLFLKKIFWEAPSYDFVLHQYVILIFWLLRTFTDFSLIKKEKVDKASFEPLVQHFCFIFNKISFFFIFIFFKFQENSITSKNNSDNA